MSVKGFSFDGGTTVQKYDYTELDNKPTIPAVDNTLSTAGSSADAKKVGDELSDLKNALRLTSAKSNLILPIYDQFERITSNPQGDWVSSTNRIACRTILYTDKQLYLYGDSGYKFAYNTFNSSGVYIDTSGWKTGVTVISAKTYFCVLLAKSDNATINTDESLHIWTSILSDTQRMMLQTSAIYGTSGTMAIPTVVKDGTALTVTLPTRLFMIGYDFSVHTKDFSEV